MKFKNDKERTAFLEEYRNESAGWYMWMENTTLNRRIWRYDLKAGGALVVEEHLQTYHWPDEHLEWRATDRFLLTGEYVDAFDDCKASRTQQLDYIKKLKEFK